MATEASQPRHSRLRKRGGAERSLSILGLYCGCAYVGCTATSPPPGALENRTFGRESFAELPIAVRQVLDRRRSERGLAPPVAIPLPPGQHRDLVVTPHALSTYDSLNKDNKP